MKIVMVGTGYVGLVSGVCFAEFGFSVTCVDTNPVIISRLQQGGMTIFEPGLKELLERNVRTGSLTFSTDLPSRVVDADVVFLAVGTPSRRGDGEADLSFIEEAVDALTPVLKSGVVVAIKSTVVAGTNARIAERIRNRRPDLLFSMVSNPEFLREGSALEDFMRPDRVVVGVEDTRGRDIMNKLYRPLSLRKTPLVFTSLENAELIKYAANAFLAMKVTFINQLADLCEKVGGNVQEVAHAIGMDKRIGEKFLHAGPGFGGSCFPKDTRAFAAMGQRFDAPQRLIETVITLNEERKAAMAARIIAAARKQKTNIVAILGISFKPNTDDIREAPSLDILKALLAAGLTVRAHDPEAMEAARAKFPQVLWCLSPYEAVQGASVSVILTEWNTYRGLELKRIADLMHGHIFMDMRNIYQAADFAGTGLEYHSIGRTA